MKINKIKNNKKLLYGICLLISILVCLFIERFVTNYKIIYVIFSCILLSIGIFLIFKSGDNIKYKKLFVIMCILIGFLAGGLVNPIESGVDYYNLEPVKEVQNIVSTDPNAKWIVTGRDSPMASPIGNIFIAAGAHTINSVNTYPQLDTWEKIDPGHKYVNVYNRYAHINVILTNSSTCFMLKYDQSGNVRQDIIDLYLSVNDLKKLNVSYVESSVNLTKFNSENVTFTKIYSYDNGEVKIYKVNYHS